MSNQLKNRNLRGPLGLLAVTLSLSLSFAACTTDRHLGDGDPVVTPGVRTTPTSGVGGSESAPSVPETNPPMMSSSTTALRSAPRPMSAAEAAARMVDNLPPVRVLGPVSPGAAERPLVSEGLETGQFVQPDPARELNTGVATRTVPAAGLGVLAENVVVPQAVQAVPPMLPQSSAMGAASTRPLRTITGASGSVRTVRTTDGRLVVTNAD